MWSTCFCRDRFQLLLVSLWKCWALPASFSGSLLSFLWTPLFAFAIESRFVIFHPALWREEKRNKASAAQRPEKTTVFPLWQLQKRGRKKGKDLFTPSSSSGCASFPCTRQEEFLLGEKSSILWSNEKMKPQILSSRKERKKPVF